MKKPPSQQRSTAARARPPRNGRLWTISAIALAIGVLAASRLYFKRADPATERITGPITFNRHVAPILFENCAPCHRPTEAAPFSLLTYRDAQKRAKQIVDVTHRRYMPPWLPGLEEPPLVGARLLTERQIEILSRWVTDGALEGRPADLPATPKFKEGWQLGPPDLVVQLDRPYTVPAEGRDVYRNFVISLPITERKFIAGFEFDPGNRRVVHHAFFSIDRTGECRRVDALDAEPGFPGLHTPDGTQTPPGQFLSWQPGKIPRRNLPVQVWSVDPGTDLILQLHLQPSGKPELLQPSVALYFTDRPSALAPFKIGLRDLTIDIPAGATNQVIEQSFRLPVPVEAIAALAHAHYLGRDLEALAELPDGSQQPLLRLREWDFNWQGDYTYPKPIVLPQGTVLRMRFHYDNSTNNVRNPSRPPVPVRYGIQTTDEMAEFWLQVVPRNTNDWAILAREFQPRVIRESIEYNQYLLRLDPSDAKAHTAIGKSLFFLNRAVEAEEFLRRSIELQPAGDEPHYYLGLIYRTGGSADLAVSEFQRAVQLNNKNGKAHGNLGMLWLERNDLDRAEAELRTALQLNPSDDLARNTLAEIAAMRARK